MLPITNTPPKTDNTNQQALQINNEKYHQLQIRTQTQPQPLQVPTLPMNSKTSQSDYFNPTLNSYQYYSSSNYSRSCDIHYHNLCFNNNKIHSYSNNKTFHHCVPQSQLIQNQPQVSTQQQQRLQQQQTLLPSDLNTSVSQIVNPGMQ